MNNKLIPIKKIDISATSKLEVVNAIQTIGIAWITTESTWPEIASTLLNIENYTYRQIFEESIELKPVEDLAVAISHSFQRLADVSYRLEQSGGSTLYEIISNNTDFFASLVTPSHKVTFADHVNRLLNSSFTNIGTDVAPDNWVLTAVENVAITSRVLTDAFGCRFDRNDAGISSIRGNLSQSIELETGVYSFDLSVDEMSGVDTGTNVIITGSISGELLAMSNLFVGVNRKTFELFQTETVTVQLGVGLKETTDMTYLDISKPYIHKGSLEFLITADIT